MPAFVSSFMQKFPPAAKLLHIYISQNLGMDLWKKSNFFHIYLMPSIFPHNTPLPQPSLVEK